MNLRDDESLTQLLARFSDGREEVADDLLLRTYDELRRVATGHMRRERAEHTLQATALVHELWAKMATIEQVPSWPSRGHFFKWTSKAMGNLLRDHARRTNSQKAGGRLLKITLDGTDLLPDPGSATATSDILDAIEELARVDAKRGEIVELRVFGGLEYREIAETMELTEAQVEHSLRVARAWLRDRLQP